MVRITSRVREELTDEQLTKLYEEAGWISYLKDLNKLRRAIAHSLYVLTAWHEEELIGLMRVVGDGETVLYIQDILVAKPYRRNKIATRMIEKMLTAFPEVRQKVLLTEDLEEVRAFYEEVGFMSCDQGDLVAFTRFD